MKYKKFEGDIWAPQGFNKSSYSIENFPKVRLDIGGTIDVCPCSLKALDLKHEDRVTVIITKEKMNS